jgi:hypothetical protein
MTVVAVATGLLGSIMLIASLVTGDLPAAALFGVLMLVGSATLPEVLAKRGR